MATLIKLFLIIAVFFASTFIVIKTTGVLTLDDIRHWLESAQSVSPVYIGLIVSMLLLADLFIAVPTLTVCLLSGYFLGFTTGASFNIAGVALAGVCGYLISMTAGRNLLERIVQDAQQLNDMEQTFDKYGFVMILLSRAMPILPETTACLAGFTRMKPWKFFTAWAISSIPYAMIAAYAGSISSIENPNPAILTAIGLSLFFWSSWMIVIKTK